MTHLIADRFLQLEIGSAIDCATGEPVDLVIDRAGERPEQQRWAEACARNLTDPCSRIIDFGFIGSDRRFVASTRTTRVPIANVNSISYVVEWLEHANRASTRLFELTRMSKDRSLALARELRLRGFVPMHVAMFDDVANVSVLSRAVCSRSVVLLDSVPCSYSSRIALGLLRLLSAKARHSWVIVPARAGPALVPATGRFHVAHAAEGRPIFDKAAARQRFTLAAPAVIDVRATGMLDEATRLISRGRHAAAERSLRASLAAFDRRHDAIHAGDAALALGHLLQNRGRSPEAYELFERARQQYESRSAAALAVQACASAGVAQTDCALLAESETTLRTAYSAATTLGDRQIQLTAGVALARCLLWHCRYPDATLLLERLAPQLCDSTAVRYWCLAARLHLTVGDLSSAWTAVARARNTAHGSSGPACEATVRRVEAMIQAKLGDVESLERHVRDGLRAAADAHLPLEAVRLRLTLLEGLTDAKQSSRARAVGTRLKTVAKVKLPPLLAKRLTRALERLTVPAAHETAPTFAPATRPVSNLGDVDGLTEILSICHDVDDERDALARCALAIKKHSGAIALGIFGVTQAVNVVPLASVGSSCQMIAQRCVTLGQPINVEPVAAGFEGATPIRYLGRVIGSLACRWSVDMPLAHGADRYTDRRIAFCSASAAACASLVYMLLEPNPEPAKTTGGEAATDLVGESTAIQEVRRAITRAANAPFTVLIEGESGSGKELVARAIHRAGARRERRFCPLNCAAMPEDLIDAELFGHAKGAFTGAAIERVGLFESADQGTVFLDEVGELSSRAQAKLLRVLQEGEIRRIGESFTRSIDARLIAATNRSLRAEADAGRFRQDLLYRLDVIRVAVPPLRDRVEDIPLLAVRFWRHAAERIGSKAVLGPNALSALARYDWPGNVRELQNVLIALLVSVPARGVVGASHLPAAIARATQTIGVETLDMARVRFEQRFVRAALAKSGGNRVHTAAALGLTRQGLAKLMQRLGIESSCQNT